MASDGVWCGGPLLRGSETPASSRQGHEEQQVGAPTLEPFFQISPWFSLLTWTPTVACPRLAGAFKFFATGQYHSVGCIVFFLAFSLSYTLFASSLVVKVKVPRGQQGVQRRQAVLSLECLGRSWSRLAPLWVLHRHQGQGRLWGLKGFIGHFFLTPRVFWSRACSAWGWLGKLPRLCAGLAGLPWGRTARVVTRPLGVVAKCWCREVVKASGFQVVWHFDRVQRGSRRFWWSGRVAGSCRFPVDLEWCCGTAWVCALGGSLWAPWRGLGGCVVRRVARLVVAVSGVRRLGGPWPCEVCSSGLCLSEGFRWLARGLDGSLGHWVWHWVCHVVEETDGKGRRRPERGRFGKVNRHLLGGILAEGLGGACKHLLGGVAPMAFGALVWHSGLYEQCRFQLRNSRTPLTPWAVIDGLCIPAHPWNWQIKRIFAVRRLLLQPSGCLPCFHWGGGQTWTTQARELLGTLSRSALAEVGARKNVSECTLALPWGWEQRRRIAFCRDWASVHSIFTTFVKKLTDTDTAQTTDTVRRDYTHMNTVWDSAATRSTAQRRVTQRSTWSLEFAWHMCLHRRHVCLSLRISGRRCFAYPPSCDRCADSCTGSAASGAELLEAMQAKWHENTWLHIVQFVGFFFFPEFGECRGVGSADDVVCRSYVLMTVMTGIFRSHIGSSHVRLSLRIRIVRRFAGCLSTRRLSHTGSPSDFGARRRTKQGDGRPGLHWTSSQLRLPSPTADATFYITATFSKHLEITVTQNNRMQLRLPGPVLCPHLVRREQRSHWDHG